MLLDISEHQVFDDVILSVENDVSELTKVLNDILGLEISVDVDDVVVAEFEIGVLDKFFDDWVQNSAELSTLG